MIISLQAGIVGNNRSTNFKASPKKLPPKSPKAPILSETSKIMLGLSTVGIATLATLAIKDKNILKKINVADKNIQSFRNFMTNSKKTGLNSSKDYLKECKEKNILGTGANSVVYKFSNPLMDKWAIKVDTKHQNHMESFSKPIEEVADKFEGLNMGQEIAKIGNDVHILKRIHGTPHSIKDWAAHRREGKEITAKDAETFLDDVQKIAEFPQESFNNYAEKLKVIDEKGLKADSFNPNNYLIDYKNKEMHIIDAYENPLDVHLNSKYDLFTPLVDYPNYARYHKAMTPAQQEKFVESTVIIEEKCTKAAEKAGLPTSEETFRDFIGRIDSREDNGRLYTNSFNSLLNFTTKK